MFPQPNKNKEPKFVSELPPYYRKELCRILDQDGKWEELATRMELSNLTIHEIKVYQAFGEGSSATDALLRTWGHWNHTIVELYTLIAEIKHKEAMLLLEKFVPLNLRAERRNLQPGKSPYASVPDSPTVDASSNFHQNAKEASNMDKNRENPAKLLPVKMAVLNDKDATFLKIDLPSEFSNMEIGIRKRNAQNDLMQQNDIKKTNDLGSTSKSAALSSGLKHVSFGDLTIATGGWNPKKILGTGGFGEVYKGTWRNTPVAIKRTRDPDSNRIHKAQMESIENELKNLNCYRHDNILQIYGFSIKDNDVCLIYQYMPNGSLIDRLFCRNRTKPLTWFQRLKIATGTARGLQFLHDPVQSLIHGDIKSANILLDANFVPKIGDFGLAREGPYKHYTCMKVSRVRGTIAYLPDEFLRNMEFSTKVDVYSFGIVLFELATGLQLCDNKRPHFFLKDFILHSKETELKDLADKKAGLDEFEVSPYLIELGKSCVKKRPKERPTMVLILKELEALGKLMNNFEK